MCDVASTYLVVVDGAGKVVLRLQTDPHRCDEAVGPVHSRENLKEAKERADGIMYVVEMLDEDHHGDHYQ